MDTLLLQLRALNALRTLQLAAEHRFATAIAQLHARAVFAPSIDVREDADDNNAAESGTRFWRLS